MGWKLENINEYFSYFRVMMTATNGQGKWDLDCSGMELYGQLVNSSVRLESNASVVNFGRITAESTLLSFECDVFENYGTIEAKNGQVEIKCKSFKNKFIIKPKPKI